MKVETDTDDAGNEMAYMWVDPPRDAEPDIALAVATRTWDTGSGFNRFEVTVGGSHGTDPVLEGVAIDEIRIGTSWDVINVIAQPGLASEANPVDEAIDVPVDVVLSWTPGEFASPTNGHKVYFGESFDEVNDAIDGIAQTDAYYVPGQILEFDTTYYWRVDEVDPELEFKGKVWSFTTEPIAYPIESVTATACSEVRAEEGPQNTINGSGLNDDDEHSLDPVGMWLSNVVDPGNKAWIEYEFSKVNKLYEMWVWNYNSSNEPMIGYGIKEAVIEYSVDGANWELLGTSHEFARGLGADGYACNTIIDLGGVAAKYVRITANSNWGSILNQFGLSEVRFYSIPVCAREPNPDSGATDVSVDAVLSWRPGREAVVHDVCLDTDEQAVIDGTAPVFTVAEASYAPFLDLNSTYYWRVTEVNDAEIIATWQSEVWSFSTQAYVVVDDFESYNDIPADEEGSNLVYMAWVDGWDNPAVNGSTMGYVTGPSLETGNVHDGGKSVPLAYNNVTAGISEVVRTFTPAQDWTAHGGVTLTLWFAGIDSNLTGQLYVKVNGVRVDYSGAADNLKLAEWQSWDIDLTAVGTDLSNVRSMTIGIQGPDARGTLMLDDVRISNVPASN